MANFSDDEQFQVDEILQKRKRKGVLEYLVQWKEGSSDSQTWEPAERVKSDAAVAVSSFEKSLKLKAKSRRSSSRSRKSSQSRSRSRSSSRSRKTKQTTLKKTTRSQSRGRSSESREQKAEASKEAGDSSAQVKEEASISKVAVEAQQTQAVVQTKEVVVETKTQEMSSETSSTSSRVLRSSTVAARHHSELEVQRVHNEQRPVRDDDKVPRSAIWKVADYAVIVLFIISAFAALAMFIEKFVDLGEFKKNAFPSFSVLQERLAYVWGRLVELVVSGADKVQDMWLQVVEQIKGAPKVAVKAKQ